MPHSSSVAVAQTIRGDREPPDDISEVELVQYRFERELREARDRIRHLEQALKAAGRVLQPYIGGNGR